MVDMVKVKAALKRAGHIALTGTSQQRSGRFMPVKKTNTNKKLSLNKDQKHPQRTK